MKTIVLKGSITHFFSSIRFGLLAWCLVVGVPAYADDVTAAIDIQSPRGIAYSSGTTATLSGKIDVLVNGKAPKKPLNEVSIKAYFPDYATEVTNQIHLDPTTLTFSFASAALNASNANAFTIEVGRDSREVEDLKKTKAKIEKRIASLGALVTQMIARHANHLEIQIVKNLIAVLQSIDREVVACIARKSSMIARRIFPLQIDNQTAVASLYESTIDDYKLSLSFEVGAEIEGQNTTALASVTNQFDRRSPATVLSKKGDPLIAQFLWKGAVVKTLTFDGGSKGPSAEYSFDTGALFVSAQNNLAINVIRKEKGKNDSPISLSLYEPVAADTIAPVWLAGSSLQNQTPYVKELAPISATIVDSFGRVKASSITARILGTKVDGSAVNQNMTSRIQAVELDGDKAYLVKGDLGILDEGNYILSLAGADKKGNAALPNPLQSSFQVDRTPPVVALSLTAPILTNVRNLPFVVDISDRSPTVTQVSLNGVVLTANRSENSISMNASLQEGINKIEVASIDAAGNASTPVVFDKIMLDTRPPALSNLQPMPGALLGSLVFQASGKSDKPLASVYANGTLLSLSDDKLSFSGTISVQEQGNYTIHWLAMDLVGNVATSDVPVSVSLKILNGNLVSVAPDPDGSHIWVRGSASAARAGATITVKYGFFSSASTTAAADGSFAVSTDGFTTATVTATDTSLGKSESIDVNYGVQTGGGTKLAGLIKDTTGKPLIGATVSIVGTSFTAVTDATGLFSFSDPITGDQILSVDGSSAIQPPLPAPQRQFFKTNLSISIGISQNNVLERPIYLASVPFDGTATDFAPQAGGSIASVHAPGVTLEIPAGSATLPNGSTTGKIAIASVPAEFSTIAPLDVSAPAEVITLEPSGTTFSKPVDVTVPNSSGLPAGYEVVVLSQNSQKGIWEIDGAAKVSDDGQSISTKPGMGIHHFSTIYMSPLGPKVTQMGAQDMPGTNTFDGALSSKIELPSYRSLGKALAPQLIYKSNWAKPTALVTNFFDVPYEEVTYTATSGSGFLGTFNRTIVDESAVASIRPDHMNVQFYAGNRESEPYTFRGLPNKAAVSLAIDLKNDDGSYFATNVYPYQTHWELFLNQTIIRTRREKHWSWWGSPSINQSTWIETQLLNEAFPSDFIGEIFVQNHTKSVAGSGWKIADMARIVNPQGDKVVVEDGDGKLSSYALQNTITTVLNAEDYGLDLTYGADFRSWPKIAVSDGLTVYAVDTDHSNSFGINASLDSGSFSTFGGRLASVSQSGNTAIETSTNYFFNSGSGNFFIDFATGKFYLTAPARSAVYLGSSSSGFDRMLLGKVGSIPQPVNVSNLCFNTPGVSCKPLPFRITTRTNCPNNSCGLGQTFGGWPSGIFDGDGALNDPNTDTARGVNAPQGIAPGPQANTMVLCDTGNNRVRLIDLGTNSVSTIAGNGTTMDTGDGGSATSAGIFHPLQAIYDNVGNLYIASENGFIRKVDTTGRISTFAGKPAGTVGDNILATSLKILRVGGMVIDQVNGYLYFSDRDANVVKRIDLQTNLVQTVAGNRSSGFNGDGVAALNASLWAPTHLGLDSTGNLIIADSGNQRVRKVTFQNTASGELAFSSSNGDHSTLQRLADNTWLRKFRNGTQVTYDSAGYQTAVLDRAGRQSNFDYDGDHNLVLITDPAGRMVEYRYSGGRLASIKDPAGRQTSFHYSGAFLTGVTFPDGTERAYGYNDHGLLASETNERGITTAYQYNQWDRIQKIIQPDLSEITINDVASSTAANSYTGGSVGTLQSVGVGDDQVANSIKNAKGVETVYLNDRSGYVTTIIDANGKTTFVERDNVGKPIKITRPDRTTISFVYDLNNPNSIRQNDLLSASDSATGITVSMTYDDYGNVLSKKNGRGYTITNTFDPNTGFLIAVTDPLNHAKHYTYGSLGVLQAATDAHGKSVTYGYDSFGNLKSERDPLGNVTSYTLDVAGNILSSTNAKNQTSSYAYDTFNRMLSVTTPKNEKTDYVYDETGNLVQVKDAEEGLSVFHYDLMGRMDSKKDPIGFETTFDYDLSGNLVRSVDPNGNIKTFVYNEQNQITRKNLPDNVIQYVYDDSGNLTSISNGSAINQFTYDKMDRLISATSQGLGSLSGLPAAELDYTYDNNGNRIQMLDPTGTTTYTYDVADRIKSITNSRSEIYTFNFDAANRLTSMSRPGSASSLAFDDSGFLTSMIHSKGATTLASFAYGRDAIGNRTQIDRTVNSGSAGTRTIASVLSYDNDNQLVGYQNPEAPTAPMQTEGFGYDSVYNRTSDQGGVYTYDAKFQRLTEDYRNIYLYDNNGNLISKQAKGLGGEVTNFTYTSENQLVGIKVYASGISSPSKEISYAYDSLGRRIHKQVVDHDAESDPRRTFTRRYVYDGQNILLEYDGDNRLLAQYTHGALQDDDVLAVYVTSAGASEQLAASAGSYQYLKDAQGSIVDVADGGGNKIQHYIYSAFGALLGIQDANAADITTAPVLATSYGFTGREFDSESGLMYYRARYYDPSLGRFLQKDPHPGVIGIPASSVNAYSYAANSPLNLRDPSGQSWLGDLAIGLGVAVLIVLSGGTVGGALLAVGSVAVGAAAGAALTAAFQDGSFKENFQKNFHINFMIGLALLAGSVVVADLVSGFSTGSFAGVAKAGGNGLNGYIVAKETIGTNGALTLGSATVYSGGESVQVSLAAHEFGHTLQFLGLSAILSNKGPAASWGAYLGLGILGAISPNGAGAFWENSATSAGSAL